MTKKGKQKQKQKQKERGKGKKTREKKKFCCFRPRKTSLIEAQTQNESLLSFYSLSNFSLNLLLLFEASPRSDPCHAVVKCSGAALMAFDARKSRCTENKSLYFIFCNFIMPRRIISSEAKQISGSTSTKRHFCGLLDQLDLGSYGDSKIDLDALAAIRLIKIIQQIVDFKLIPIL